MSVSMQIADLTGVEGRGEYRIVHIFERRCTRLNLQFARENVNPQRKSSGRNF